MAMVTIRPAGLSVGLLLSAALGLLSGCESDEQGEQANATAGTEASPQRSSSVAPAPSVPAELAKKPAADAGPDAEAAPPHPGPWLFVTESSVGIYPETVFDRKKKLGYARRGAKVPILAGIESKSKCSRGWYKVASGGFVCGNGGTLDENHPEVKLGPKPPNTENILPYLYARNREHGTPLYKSVPSREQMLKYEPYLSKDSDKDKASGNHKPESKEKQESDTHTSNGDTPGDTRQASLERSSGSPVVDRDAGAGLSVADLAMLAGIDAGAPEPETPWWQRDEVTDVKIEDLSQDADDILAQRLVTGFYVAVDKTFRWNHRTWYRTTKNLVVPADRFWQTAGPKFKGAELGNDHTLPVGWVFGSRKKVSTYTIDTGKNQIKPARTLERFDLVDLTGDSLEFRGKDYYQTTDDDYVRAAYVRITEPGEPPEDVADAEVWLDINLAHQTLTAFRGKTPVYATLISSGKKSSIKEKDHRTPQGVFRVREKHVTTTMDGNGTAAGDLPYSIEDVPYVMYFHRSYAVHGAFWHNNFGVRMSHGCVNLAPLDAKYLFQITNPRLPEGWHGVWSSDAQPGSRVVIHD